MVHQGLVYFKGMRFTSMELHTLWRERTGGELTVQVQRVDGDPSYLIWKLADGPEGLLSLTVEDALRFGGLSWIEIDMMLKRESNLLSQPEPIRRRRAPTRK